MSDSGGYVWLVGAGPGDPDLITLRGHKALHSADVVLYDALVNPELLTGVQAQRIYVGKRSGRHSLPQEEICDLLVRLARAGKRVVRLKGGDPTVLGRGGEEGIRLGREGLPFEIVPGISSSIAAAASAGIPVTHRGVAEAFTVLTAHRRKEQGEFAIPAYCPKTTLVLLMGVATTPIWQAQLLDQGYPEDLPVAFVTQGCGPDQRVVTTSVGNAQKSVESQGIEAPSIAIIGKVVELRPLLAWHATDVDINQPALLSSAG